MDILITYLIVSVIGELLYLYRAYKSLKKALDNKNFAYMISEIKKILNKSAYSRRFKRKAIYWSPLILLLLVVACPFMFPFSVLSDLKKLIGYKSETDKEIEKEKERAIEAKKKSDEWWKKEGDLNPINPNRKIDLSELTEI